MRSYISFDGGIDSESSYQLQKLASLIEDENGLTVALEKRPATQGERDGGLVTGIAIASLSLAAIQALVATLQYWESRQPKYSISVVFGDTTLQIDNLTEKQIEETIKRLQATSSGSSLEVKVLRNS
ncbi:MAG: hypothetical protein AAFY72_06650 [Cyanobacteria bacterium J06649_4]